MSTVKFRSWNKVSKEMSYNVVINGAVETEAGDEVLMQYIGRTDADDVEVYDGDIVSFMEDDKNFYSVKWDDRKCAFGIYYRTLEAFNPGMLIFMQVKGNICQNPELVR